MALAVRNLHSSMHVVEKFGAQKREAKLPFSRSNRMCGAAITPPHAPSPLCPYNTIFLRASGRGGTCEVGRSWDMCLRWGRSMSRGCDASVCASCSAVFWDVPWCVSCLILLMLPSAGRCPWCRPHSRLKRPATRSCPSHNLLHFHG